MKQMKHCYTRSCPAKLRIALDLEDATVEFSVQFEVTAKLLHPYRLETISKPSSLCSR